MHTKAHGRIRRSEFYVLFDRVAEKAHDGEFVYGVEQSVMRFAVTVIFRKNAKHRLYAVAAFQSPRPADRCAVLDHRIVLHVCRKPHDVVPFQSAEFGQVSLVEQGIIGK